MHQLEVLAGAIDPTGDHVFVKRFGNNSCSILDEVPGYETSEEWYCPVAVFSANRNFAAKLAGDNGTGYQRDSGHSTKKRDIWASEAVLQGQRDAFTNLPDRTRQEIGQYELAPSPES
ncbi:hypothetical protein AVEN_81897-1 [Araneus ventricosus]|uniref:Uncharacterized protein n=1 Tax=Araneus ventricosus TaxID=182803 RepID=A0A4Y2I4C9_ARAVE|nr:hypothetical protein AVEN_81897-1 [Araneus ventricosus]